MPSELPNPLDYPKLILDLVNQQGRMQEQLNEVTEVIKEIREERKAEHFTRKDLILAILGSMGGIAVVFSGFFFLIGTQINPFAQELHTFETETHDRFAQIMEVYNERLKAQLEAVQANRAVNIEQDREINEIRLQNAATAARLDRAGTAH